METTCMYCNYPSLKRICNACHAVNEITGTITEQNRIYMKLSFAWEGRYFLAGQFGDIIAIGFSIGSYNDLVRVMMDKWVGEERDAWNIPFNKDQMEIIGKVTVNEHYVEQ